MMRIISQLLILLVMVTLSSCMSPVKTGPDMGYVISATPDQVKKTHTRSGTILVMAPDTNPVYNTKRMAFTTRPYQITYYSQSHWVEAPSVMFEPLIVQTLQKTRHYHAVTTPPFTGSYNYTLRTEIKTLLIDYTNKVPVLRFSVQADLISAASNRLISSREFTASVPLPQASPYGAVYAANIASSKVLQQMAAWSISHT